MAKDRNVSSGNTSMLLLRLLSERDMYGYGMIETLQKRSEFVFNLKTDTTYPLLHIIEAKRLLVSHGEEAQGEIHRYYSITKEGRGVLARKKEDQDTCSEIVEHVIGGTLYGNA